VSGNIIRRYFKDKSEQPERVKQGIPYKGTLEKGTELKK